MQTFWARLSSGLCQLQLQRLIFKSRLLTPKDVNLKKVTSQHCRVPLWLVPQFFASCPQPLIALLFLLTPFWVYCILAGAWETRNLSSPSSPYRNTLNHTVAEAHFCSVCNSSPENAACAKSWGFWYLMQSLRWHLKRSQQGIFLGACIFQSHFCC